MGLSHADGSPNLDPKTKPNNYQQKKRTCNIVDFAVPADYGIKLKEYEKKDKYLDLARELKKTWEDLQSLNPTKKPLVNACVKNLKRSKITIKRLGGECDPLGIVPEV